MLQNFNPNKVTVNDYKGIEYYNIPCSYDIETSSFLDDNGEKTSLIYSHMFSINGQETLLRYDNHMQEYIHKLTDEYETQYNSRHLVIYVHNLQYEFQFIKHLLEIVPESVFVVGTKRRVVKFVTKSGIEFRCSYILTNRPLALWAKDLGMRKMEGDLIYNLVRTPETPLTKKELGYIYEDVRIIIKGIKEFLKDDNIVTIPMTQTGFTRRSFREYTLSSHEYSETISGLTMSHNEYELLKTAYSGGLTRANARYSMKVLNNVLALDENSEYPFEQCANKFPMSKGIKVNNLYDMKQVEPLFVDHCVLMTLELSNLESIRDYTLISEHKVICEGKKIIDNGRIVMCDKVTMTMTETDYNLYKQYYNFEVTKVGTIYKYKAGYLPVEYILKILELYGNKTSLKNIEGMEHTYRKSKEEINCIYGASVSSPIHQPTIYLPEIGIIEEQQLELDEIIEALGKHNDNYNRFLFYPWGVWTTSYARYSLMSLNMKLEDAGIKDYYCDTDSRYIEDSPLAQAIVDEENRLRYEKISKVLDAYGIPLSKLSPKDHLGQVQTFGEWALDGKYKKFKTLGAKRYMCEDYEGNQYITVSGLRKKAVGYIKGAGGFDYFNDGMEIPDFASGRKTLTYIDHYKDGITTDYLGNTFEYSSYSGIHMDSSSFTMKLGVDYKSFINAIMTEENKKMKH